MLPRPERGSAKGSSPGGMLVRGLAVTMPLVGDALGRGRLVSAWTASIFLLNSSGLSG